MRQRDDMMQQLVKNHLTLAGMVKVRTDPDDSALHIRVALVTFLSKTKVSLLVAQHTNRVRAEGQFHPSSPSIHHASRHAEPQNSPIHGLKQNRHSEDCEVMPAVLVAHERECATGRRRPTHLLKPPRSAIV